MENNLTSFLLPSLWVKKSLHDWKGQLIICWPVAQAQIGIILQALVRIRSPLIFTMSENSKHGIGAEGHCLKINYSLSTLKFLSTCFLKAVVESSRRWNEVPGTQEDVDQNWKRKVAVSLFASASEKIQLQFRLLLFLSLQKKRDSEVETFQMKLATSEKNAALATWLHQK